MEHKPSFTDEFLPVLESASRTHELARLYLSWGFIPLPIRPDTKAPFGRGWNFTTRETAIENIRRAMQFFGPNHSLNLGILCGDASAVIILDVDRRDDGVRVWETLEGLHGPINTFRIRTGGGGLHLYFQYTHAIQSRIGVRYLGRSIGWDVRTDSDNTLGPFSIHPQTGKLYEVIGGMYRDERGDLVPRLERMPVWLLKILAAQ